MGYGGKYGVEYGSDEEVAASGGDQDLVSNETVTATDSVTVRLQKD